MALTKDLKAERKERGQQLTKEFAGVRRRVGAARGETERQSRVGFDRLQALTGQTGGAIEKARQKSISNIGQEFAGVQAGVTGQEASARQALSSEIGQRGEALAESKLAREQQQKQFRETLNFQRESFFGQLGFQFAELEENKKTNLINAAVALDEAGIRSQADWDKMLAMITGKRAPGSKIPGPDVGSGVSALEQRRLESSQRQF
jgi:hypothetical protein